MIRFADGTQTPDNSTYGAWLVMNTKETYFGGPLHSDLMVDGIVYNYVSLLLRVLQDTATDMITDRFKPSWRPDRKNISGLCLSFGLLLTSC